MPAATDAITKLQNLSEERAGKVFSLIEDLAELEELEKAADLKAAREALAEGGPTVPYEQLRREIGLDR
ncbi:MAG: type II toxin-antitoxin system Phd/YefM family antitoxin [Verrucomicrobia bacterium]|nr:type II toxin-antitoxin system Phd/YefM family antitoxin [Verrucomicrobiota bacterium]